MAIDTFAGPVEDDHDDPVLAAQANAALEAWLRDHAAVAREISQTVRAHIHLQELDGRAREAERAAREAEQRDAVLVTKLDPAGHRVLGFAVGAALVVILVVLDGVPLNWAAQAFDLDSAGTWLVTLILVVASAGAMLGFEVTRGDTRRRGALVAVIAAGYLAVLGLRAEFLAAVAGAPFPVAFLQAAMLTAISAGLIVCGAVILARTRSPGLSRARAAARHARRAAADARAAQHQAAERVQRHLGGLKQLLLPWALGSAAPAGVDRAAWAAALERAVRALFPPS